MSPASIQVRPVGLALLFSLLASAPLLAITPESLARRLAGDGPPPQIIDVRPNHEFTTAHIPGAINIPFEVLPHRTLPPLKDVIVVADGLGRIDAVAAAALVGSRLPDATIDALEGGFAAWDNGNRPSTHRMGFSAEVLPAINYATLIAGREDDFVLVDLREPTDAQPAATAGTTAAAGSSDPIRSLAAKIPGAQVAASPFAVRQASTASTRTRTLAPAPLSSPSGVAPLLVLIDNNDGRAQEIARKLTAMGNRRFVILTGGIESVRLEGRSLVERTGGAVGQEGVSQP